MIGTVHLRDRCQRSRHHRHIGRSGNLQVNALMHQKLRSPDGVILWSRVMVIWTIVYPDGAKAREFGDRESWRHVHGDIENAETPMEV
jgi:hypothetical protein